MLPALPGSRSRLFVALLVGAVHAVLPFFEINLPFDDHPECIDYSTDCQSRAGLCRNAAFKEIMHAKCARTCGLCDQAAQPSVHNDGDEYADNILIQSLPKKGHKERRKPAAVPLYNEADGDRSLLFSAEQPNESDEYASESAEPNMNHLILRPPPSPPTRPPPPPPSPSPRSRRNCADQAPNCFYLKSLCFNKFYLPVMQKNCRRTCGFCAASQFPVRGYSRFSKPRPPANVWVEPATSGYGPPEAGGGYGSCRNRGLDCEERLNLCTHWRYWRLMRRICALSCGFCDPDEFR